MPRTPPRRPGRGPTALGAGLLTLLLAASAGAVPLVRLVWAATSGSGATGGGSIDALPGDVLTLRITVANTSPAIGVSFAGISLAHGEPGAASGLTALAAIDCPDASTTPAGGNLFGGGTTCTPTGFTAPFMTPFAPGVTIDAAANTLGSFDAGATPPQFSTGTIELGTASFLVSASEDVRVFYAPGLDSVNDGLFNVFFPFAEASVVVVPEPGAAGLVALGLLGLALATRRR